jgi:molybdate transport repressor ModE-like protein
VDARQWAGLEVRHLLALRAIAEHGSFHQAAAHLDYTQSGISQQLAALERIVGERLVDRPGGGRPTRLTPAGERLLDHGQVILDRVAAARADLTQASSAVRVGAFQSVGATLLPLVLDELARAAPHLRIELTQTTADEPLLALLREGELDVTFAQLPLPAGPFVSVELLSDAFVLLVAADSDLLAHSADPVQLADLDGVPLVASHACRYTGVLEARMRDAGLRAHVAHRTDDDGTVLGLVARGVGVACVPGLIAETADDRLDVLQLAEPMERRIALVWHRDREHDAARTRFVDLARALTDRHRAPASF